MPHEIAIFKEYIENFISKPNPGLNNFAVCPFAKTAKIDFEIYETITPVEVSKLFEAHQNNLLIIIIKQATLEDLNKLAESVGREDWVIFKGHPEDNFSINGIFTRKDPYPNLQFIKKQELLDARASLSENYYANWSETNLKDVDYSKPPDKIKE